MYVNTLGVLLPSSSGFTIYGVRDLSFFLNGCASYSWYCLGLAALARSYGKNDPLDELPSLDYLRDGISMICGLILTRD